MDESLPWSLNLSGKPELRCGASVTRFKTKHCLLVLAILATSEVRVVSRQQLAQLVWPSAELKAARDSLRTALTELRHALPKGWLVSGPDSVELVGDLVVDVSGDPKLFMSGFDQDWVVEFREQLRDEAVRSVLETAQRAVASGDDHGALEALGRCLDLDPHHEVAAAMKVDVLQRTGHRAESIRAASSFRTRMWNDYGIVSTVRAQTSPASVHPLISAAEFLLDTNPDEGVAMLAATHQQWLSLPVKPALAIHARALEGARIHSRDYQLVNALHAHLQVLAGEMANLSEAELQYEQATHNGEPLVAYRLATALAYGYLSRGNFQSSINYAKLSKDRARDTKMPTLEVETDHLISIIWTHTGRTEEADAVLENAWRKVERLGSTQHLAGHLNLSTEHLVRNGELDKAMGNLEHARRLAQNWGSTRMTGWITIGEAAVFEAAGELLQARTLLDSVDAEGENVGGQAIIAMNNDRRARVDCKMGAFDRAAESLARATLFRKDKGVVPSVAERAFNQKTRAVLSDRLDLRDWQSALQRAQESLPKSGPIEHFGG